MGQRWKRTEDFEVPGKGFCEDASARLFVDATPTLLERSIEKPFPALMRHHGSNATAVRRHKRQRKMYKILRKVLLCDGEDEEKVVYRATDGEVTQAVSQLSLGLLSKDAYMKAVMKHCRARSTHLAL